MKNSQINNSVLGCPSCTLPPFLCLSVLLLATLKLESNFFIKCLASIIKLVNNEAVTTTRF